MITAVHFRKMSGIDFDFCKDTVVSFFKILVQHPRYNVLNVRSQRMADTSVHIIFCDFLVRHVTTLQIKVKFTLQSEAHWQSLYLKEFTAEPCTNACWNKFELKEISAWHQSVPRKNSPTVTIFTTLFPFSKGSKPQIIHIRCFKWGYSITLKAE